MKRNRFSEEQIIGILKEHEAGVPVADLCRKHVVSNASIYNGKPSMAAAGRSSRWSPLEKCWTQFTYFQVW